MNNFTPIMLVIVSIGLFFTYVDPEYKKIQGIKVEHKQFKEALANSSELIKVREELSTTYNNYSTANIGRIEKFLPSKVGNVRLTMDIAGVAAERGITIKKIEIVENKKTAEQINQNALESATLAFSFSSNYAGMKGFIQDLQLSLRMVELKSIKLKSSEKGINTYDVILETFWLK